jgi:hypothetical protein
MSTIHHNGAGEHAAAGRSAPYRGTGVGANFFPHYTGMQGTLAYTEERMRVSWCSSNRAASSAYEFMKFDGLGTKLGKPIPSVHAKRMAELHMKLDTDCLANVAS